MITCYFTATGNCLYVARRIGGELKSIPQLMKQDEIVLEDEAVGIVCPVYAVEMPMMVREFMRRAKIHCQYFFFIYTYGMGYGEAFTQAELAAREAGLSIGYHAAVQMVDNYLPIFDMQEQIDTLPSKNVEGQLARVCADITERKIAEVKVTAAKKLEMTMWHETHAAKILKKDTALSYTVNDDCILCGTCERVCPADNITVTEAGVEFSDHCEVCYACLHNCPKSAIHLPVEANTVHFRNEHVKLADIIAANE